MLPETEAALRIVSLSHRIQLACTDLGWLGADHQSTGNEMKYLKGQLDRESKQGSPWPDKSL